jgi:hypothetical protein
VRVVLLSLPFLACGHEPLCSGATLMTVTTLPGVDAGTVIPVGAPALLHLAVPGRYECVSPDQPAQFVNASEAFAEVDGPQNTLVMSSVTLTRDLGTGPAGTGDAEVKFTPAEAGPYHLDVRFEPSFGRVQADVTAE